MHRPTTGQPHTNGRDLAGVVGFGVDPDARELAQPAGVRQPELGECVDDELLD